MELIRKLLMVAAAAAAVSAQDYRGWPVYGGGPDNLRYSRLTQINRQNVARLKPAWTFDTGDAFPGSEMQCNPIVVDGVLYATTPKGHVIALDAATGRLRWRYDPREGAARIGKSRSRGVTYWRQGAESRLFVSYRHSLIALHPETGRPVPSFGAGGRVDLREGLGREPRALSVTNTTPGVIYRDVLILGTLVPEDLPSAPGDVRAYDVRTGKIRWAFHTLPRPGEFGYDTWPKEAWKVAGGTNSWAGMSVDEKRGLVFIPTGSASYDFYGANRHGDNLFANCLLALRAETGERVWHFQFVRHDVWDRDLPTPPSLITVLRGGKRVDAVAQSTKSGHVFVFDRETGRPLFPIEERPAAASRMDGERLAASQPLPLKPPPFARQILTEDMLTRRTPEANAWARAQFRKFRSAGQFEPPGFEGTVIFPGFDGGAEWGGQAFDPETGLYYVNANEMAWILRLVPRRAEGLSGRGIYLSHCASCHREDLKGTPPEFPSLVDAGARHSIDAIRTLVQDGAGRMPAYGHLGKAAVQAVSRYVTTGQDEAVAGTAAASGAALKYTTDGYNKFLDPDGYPAIEPPWGTLTAIDMNRGEFAWRIPLGEFPKLAEQGIRDTGSENYGGPVVTAGGLVFIAATNHDRKIRAFDKSNGKLLWEYLLPASGNATPSVFAVNGRQFVVIACGGGKSGAPSGGSYVAFALPD